MGCVKLSPPKGTIWVTVFLDQFSCNTFSVGKAKRNVLEFLYHYKEFKWIFPNTLLKAINCYCKLDCSIAFTQGNDKITAQPISISKNIFENFIEQFYESTTALACLRNGLARLN